MATKSVNIDIIAKDKTKMAMDKAMNNVDKVKTSVLNLKNAFIGLGAGLVVKSFIDVGKQVESLQIRLKFLFGSVEEGAKAFDVMSKFASRVPFSLEQIQQGAGVLAVVSKDADELSKVLEITGNVASVTGLDFRTTAEQIQRSLSAGISSADIFREKGVKSLLGFSAGAKVSVEQTREALFRVFGKDGEFANATDDLANTLEGTLSMIGDKFFAFQKTVAEAFFVGLKKEFGALDDALAENEDVIQKVAKAVGEALSNAVILAGKGVKFLHDNFETLKAIGMGLVVFKITQSFLGLALALGRVRLGMIALSRFSKTTLIGILAGIGIAVAEATGNLDKFFALFEKQKTLPEFEEEMAIILDQLEMFQTRGDKGFKTVARSTIQLMEEMEKVQGTLQAGTQEFQALDEMIMKLATTINNIPIKLVNVDIKKQAEELSLLTRAYESFSKGFMESVNAQKSGFKQIEDIGKQSFGKLKQTLADFVITGKLNFGNLKDFVVRSFIEMLIGEAVKMAFAKSMALFKADALKKSMISLFEGAMKTFASIPFPLNIVAVGGALAFGNSLINKIKGFAEGGRPPVGRPSIVGEKGAELFVPDQAGTIVPNDKLGMGQPVTVNFNINTVDARGFNELLVNSRGVIVNMINQAVNEKGRMAIV